MRKKNWRSYFFQAHNVSCQTFLRLSSWSNTSYNFLIFFNYLATCRKFHLKISTERNYYAQMWTKTNTHTFMWFSRKNLTQVFLFFFPLSVFTLIHTTYTLALWCTHTHTFAHSLTHAKSKFCKQREIQIFFSVQYQLRKWVRTDDSWTS